MFRYLKNLSSHEAAPIEAPWTVINNRPQLADKTAYRNWCNAPTTDHVFFGAVEGRIPGLRVSETNPPSRMFGLVVDYDSPPVPASGGLGQYLHSKAPAGLCPSWYSTTFSGNVRTLYLFEEPIPVFGENIARLLLKKFYDELKLRKVHAGLDDEAVLDPSKYYEIGTDWKQVKPGEDCRIARSLLENWVAHATETHAWSREGVSIPLEDIRKEIATRFPEAQWPGGLDGFQLGARGPRFWDLGAADPTAAVVRESGMQYFSDGGGFATWEAIFGAQFVRHWRDDRIGSAIKDYYFDGKAYWKKRVDGVWAPTEERHLQETLEISHRLTGKAKAPGEISEVRQAMNTIRETKVVRSAAPLLFLPDGLVIDRGDRVLNTSTLRPVLPANTHCEWGVGFPRVANFLSQIFPAAPAPDGTMDLSRQLNHYLAWLRHFYLGALNQAPRRGLALFLAGPPGAGKTLLNKGVMSQLMGGSETADRFLLEGDPYNDRLFLAPLWTIDDAVGPEDLAKVKRFSHAVKQIVANDRLSYRRMYSSTYEVGWVGRLVVTMNDDPESLRVLPQTDIGGVLDKLSLLRVQKPSVPGWEMENDDILTELPCLAAFLRDWVPPAYCVPHDPRFGVAPYHHPSLLVAAGSSNDTSTFSELLDLWRGQWFGPSGPGGSDPNWSGSPTALAQAIGRIDDLKDVARDNFKSPTVIGRHLNKMINRGSSIVTSPTPRTFVISRP